MRQCVGHRQAAPATAAPLVVILAGGEGRRIGGNKPLRMLGGERLIDRALRAARLWSDDVRLALRTAAQMPSLGIPVIVDDPRLEGPLAGLDSALRAADEAGRHLVLTIACDVPFLPPDLAQRLLESIEGHAAALAQSGDDLHPACALWRADVLDRLPDYLRSGRRSLIGFAETVGFARARWHPDHFLNVNSPADLAEAERRFGSKVEHLDDRSGLNGCRSRP